MRLLSVVCSLVSLSACSAAPPAPEPPAPTVHVVPAVGEADPVAYPELTRGASPKPLPVDAVTADWATFLGSDRNGRSVETRLATTFSDDGPALVWSMERGQGYSCPVVAGDRLVYTHRDGAEIHVECLQAETGLRYWRHTDPTDYRGPYISDNGPRATPTIDGNRVYVHGVAGVLRCLDLASGALVWKRDLASEYRIPEQFFGVVSSPLVDGGNLIVNVGAPGGPCVVAFDKTNGQVVWRSGDEWGPGCSSPVIGEVDGRRRLFVLTGGASRPPTGGLMVIDPANGAIDFEHAFRSRTYESVNGASPIVGGDRVFITASYGTGTAGIGVSEDGAFREDWKVRGIGMQFSNPVFLDGHLYAIDGRADRAGAVVCLDPESGEELSRTDLYWEETVVQRGAEKTLTRSIGEGSLLIVDGRVLCLGDNGHLLWLDVTPAGTTVLARTHLFDANESWTPPVVSRGLLYVCQNNRERFGADPQPARLMCFDLRGE